MKDAGRRLLTLLVLSGLPAITPGCHIQVVGVDDGEDWDRVEVSSSMSRILEVAGETGLRFLGLNGSVHVIGADDGENFSVHAIKKVRSYSRADAQAHLELLRVDIGSQNGEMFVETHQPAGTGRRDYIVDYQITLPRGFQVRITNGNGSVRAEGLQAGIRIENANGDVVLRGHRGSSWVAVGNGQIDAAIHLPAGGRIVHRVGNGWTKLRLQNQVSAQLLAQVGNGSISHSGLVFSDMASGPNFLHGTLGSGLGDIELTVGNGWISLEGS